MRIALAGLAALAVAMGIGRFAFTPILPMMQQDAGLSVAGGGWLASANYLGYLAGALWAGAVRAEHATAIRAGLAAIALATLAMALDTGFAAWALLRFIAGLASAWVLVHTSAWCLERIVPMEGARTLPRGRPILAGVLFAGVGAGVVVAGSVCALLMTVHAGSSSAWLLLGIVSFATTAAVWPVFHSSGGKDTAPRVPHLWTWEQARLVLAYGAYGLGYIIPATFLPVMARAVVSDPKVFGWAWPLFGAAAALSTLGVALLTRRYGNRAAWIGSHLVMALGVAAPVFWPGIGGIVLAALCVGGTFVVITMVGLQEARIVAATQAPRLMAAMTAAFAAGQVAGPLSVSLLVVTGGGFSAALLIASALLVAGAALLLVRR
ncbi:MAG: YbfB/YjiJ family MFS transporter [Betaproteobacteria bacterium]